MNNWLNIIQNKLLTPHCILCGHRGFSYLDICVDCFADLPRNQYCCYQCGEHFDIAMEIVHYCGRCLSQPPAFDKTLAPFLYQDSMRYLVTGLKFAQQFQNARLLANLLAETIDISQDLPEVLIPLPLHPNRYQERQFNQSIELARHLSKRFNISMDLSSCQRLKDTVHQTSLAAKQRQKNMHNAFSVKNTLNAKHVTIIDDVLTTGASASALASALKEKGVCRVDVWVCARA